MSTHKYMDKICIVAMLIAVLTTLILMNGKHFGIKPAQNVIGYENQLFDDSRVHTIEIVMKDWDKFISSCEDKKYASCTVVIDGEKYSNVGIRAKGSTSLEGVKAAGNSKYSFKLEFDHYQKAIKYHGLDKLTLNNLIYDNTQMMDYLTYTMMADFGVCSPLCSYTNIKVNGEKWGFYLAVEGLEESFLKRNYGVDYGNLYKSDSSKADEENIAVNDEQVSRDEQASSNEQAPNEDDAAVNLSYIDDQPKSYALFFDSSVNKITKNDKKRFIAAIKGLNDGKNLERYVDTDAVIRYFVVHNFVLNGDSYTGESPHNYYLHEKNGKLSMIPWDYNLSFGGFVEGDSTQIVNAPVLAEIENRPMLNWIMSNENYKTKYQKYYREFLNSANLTERIEKTRNLIAPHVKADPRSFYTESVYQKATETLKIFCELRSNSIKGQLDGTIPSTYAEQVLNRNLLVNASGIDVFDMSSMMDFEEEK